MYTKKLLKDLKNTLWSPPSRDSTRLWRPPNKSEQLLMHQLRNLIEVMDWLLAPSWNQTAQHNKPSIRPQHSQSLLSTTSIAQCS